MKAAPVTEKQFMESVIDLARVYGWLRYHVFDSQRSVAGFPDLVLVRPPRIVIAELKKDDKSKTTPAQDQWIAAFMGCPQVEVFVWRPDDWEEIVRTLSRRPQ